MPKENVENTLKVTSSASVNKLEYVYDDTKNAQNRP